MVEENANVVRESELQHSSVQQALYRRQKNGPLDVPKVFAWRDETPRRSLPRRRANAGLSVVEKTPAVQSRDALDGDASVDIGGERMDLCDSPSAPESLDDEVSVTKTDQAAPVDPPPSVPSPSEQLAERETSDVDRLRDVVARLNEQLAEREAVEARLKEQLAERETRLKENLTERETMEVNMSFEIELLKNEASSLKRFTFSRIAGNAELVRFYTGLPSAEAFDALYLMIEKYIDGGLVRHHGSTFSQEEDKPAQPVNLARKHALPAKEELFLTLMRLRLAAPLADLASRFDVHLSTVSRVFNTYLDVLYRHFALLETRLWPSRQVIDRYMPDEFKRHYPSTRCVIDCTEIKIEQPSDPDLQRVTWSSYKNHNTLKGLVAITPDGCLSFVSKLYGGSVSDREVTQKCGFLDLLEPGDSVMADKGFTIADLLEQRGASLNIPPFLEKKDQLTADETVATRRIAKLRIHVERQMERLKNVGILRFIPITMCDMADKLFFVCSWLTQFQPPLCP